MTQKLEKAKRLYETANADQKYVLESLFPELKESEDERIKKGLIKAVSRTFEGNTLFGTDVTREEALAWLEKQGKQNNSWSKEDETGLGDALGAIDMARTIAKDENDMGNLWYAERWLKSLKDRYTWKPSDEQMEALKGVQEGVFRLGILESLYQDLKKLREE